MGALTGGTSVIALLAISLFAFVMGSVFRRWPEKVHEFVEPVDGSAYLLSPQALRATTQAAGVALWLLAFAALVAAGLKL